MALKRAQEIRRPIPTFTAGVEAWAYTKDGGVTVAVHSMKSGERIVVRVPPSICRAAAKTTRKRRVNAA